MKFMVDTCYANYFSNVSLSFKIDVVSLSEPRRLSIEMYSDHCHASVANRYLYESQCEPFFGDYYGVFTIVPRVSCYGGDSCATITTAEQVFYEQRACRGQELHLMKFPVSVMNTEYQKSFGQLVTVEMEGYDQAVDSGAEYGPEAQAVKASTAEEEFFYEKQHMMPSYFPVPSRSPSDSCIRGANGTMMFLRDPNGTQIHEFMFDLSADCTPLDFVGYRWYAYTVGHCYMMQGGYSFKWATPPGSGVSGYAAALGLAVWLGLLSA